MGVFDVAFYVQRNKETAIRLFGNKLEENTRKVKGTSIWFDEFWRYNNEMN